METLEPPTSIGLTENFVPPLGRGASCLLQYIYIYVLKLCYINHVNTYVCICHPYGVDDIRVTDREISCTCSMASTRKAVSSLPTLLHIIVILRNIVSDDRNRASCVFFFR